MALLKPKAANKTKTISIRVPMEVATELDNVKCEADQHGLALNVAEIVERALMQAIRSARVELAEVSASDKPLVAK